MSNDKDGKGKRSGSPIPTVEWMVAAVGCCLVLATFGVLGYSATRGEVPAARLSVRVDSTVVVQGEAFVMFTVLNDGGRTATVVQVDGAADGGADQTHRTLTIDFLPPHSSESAVLVFPGEIASREQVEVRVVSYRE